MDEQTTCNNQTIIDADNDKIHRFRPGDSLMGQSMATFMIYERIVNVGNRIQTTNKQNNKR
jgi:hypothetical protein